jgi:hyaluronan synthase
MKTAYTRTDWLYCAVLAVTALAGGATVFLLYGDEELLVAFTESDMGLAYAGFGFGFPPLAFLLLSWRTWLAWRYRPFAPCADARLPLATVIIPAYNEGRHVLATIRSVIASDYPAAKLRIVCVDDGSQDDTWQWLKAADREFPGRLTLLRQPRNMGKRHAVLAGFRQSAGEVLVTIDSDSLILPDTLRHLVSPLAVSPRVGAVAGNVRVLNCEDGAIPKMLDVSFSMSFDFLRRGQGVYGGVLCTPGALSAYRREALAPVIEAWAEQTFFGRPANIGEDRALSNIILGQGLRVVFQKDAVVLTTIPATYSGLYRMLLRWARSNVRECLVMLQFLPGRFRPDDAGAAWVRLTGFLEAVFIPVTEILKITCLIGLFAAPLPGLQILTAGCLAAALLPALVYQFRRPGLYGGLWALAYSFFWVFGLSWISLWGLVTAGRSGWLTRNLADRPLPGRLATAEGPDAA